MVKTYLTNIHHSLANGSIDESIETLIESKGIDGFIVVGIDNGSDRMIEYTPNWSDTPEMEGGKYGEFIINELKPHIDKNYLTLTNRENTMIGGSSMGGLISFYIGLKYKDTFGHILAMSSFLSIEVPLMQDKNSSIV